MKAIAIKAFGSADGLAVIDLPVPAPAAGQVLIDAEAIGVGGVDAVIRRGTLGSYGFKEGHILGSEIAGLVTAVGQDVDPAWIGRRVWAFTGLGGGYAEQALAPVSEILPLPSGLTPAASVTLGSSSVVAHFALAHVHFVAGESVLVRGAGGSIGIAAVQLAAQGGAGAVVVTTSSSARGERLRSLGATEVLDRAGEGGDGYDVIVDVIAGAGLPSFFGKLNPNGRLVTVGVVGGYPPADFGMALMVGFQRSLSFAAYSADTTPSAERHAVRASHFEAAAGGSLEAVVHEVLPLEQAALAHRKMDEGEVFGRIVLTP